jgi:hypothetical protein
MLGVAVVVLGLVRVLVVAAPVTVALGVRIGVTGVPVLVAVGAGTAGVAVPVRVRVAAAAVTVTVVDAVVIGLRGPAPAARVTCGPPVDGGVLVTRLTRAARWGLTVPWVLGGSCGRRGLGCWRDLGVA